MNRIRISSFLIAFIFLMTGIPACKQSCVNNVLLQTTAMNLEVNAENLGILSSAVQNAVDTVRSDTRQFYNYPEFRRFGHIVRPSDFSLVSSAFAQESCPDQEEYISRMRSSATKFSIDQDYDAAAVGLGVQPAGTDLLSVDEIRTSYLQDFLNNTFLNAGAPAPLTISRNFFQPVNQQWVTFYFVFEEIDGTVFEDSVQAFVDIQF